MRYTFLMPAFKEPYLKEAIGSILAQTYKDFTLIVSDDCSPHNLKAIVDEYHDDRIIYRRNAHNIGVEKLVDHWNLLLSLAESDYVILSPDDDVYAPTFLEEIEKLTRKYPQTGIFKSRAQIIDAQGNIRKADNDFSERISMAYNIYNQIAEQSFYGIGCYAFNTRQLRDMGGFAYYKMAWGSDTMTNILMSRNGMGVTKDILFSFRQSGENISSRKGSPKEQSTKSRNDLQVRKDIMTVLDSMKPENNDDLVYMEGVRKQIQDEYYGLYVGCTPSYSFKDLLKLIMSKPEIFNTPRRKMAMIKSWITNR